MAALFHQGGHAEIHGIAARRHHLPRKEEIDSVHKSLSPVQITPAFLHCMRLKGRFRPELRQNKKAGQGSAPYRPDTIRPAPPAGQGFVFVLDVKIALLHWIADSLTDVLRKPTGPARLPGPVRQNCFSKSLIACQLRTGSSFLRLYQFNPHHNTLFLKKQLLSAKKGDFHINAPVGFPFFHLFCKKTPIFAEKWYIHTIFPNHSSCRIFLKTACISQTRPAYNSLKLEGGVFHAATAYRSPPGTAPHPGVG